MIDTPFIGATIISVIDDMVKVSRPYVVAHEAFNDKSGLMGCETFDIPLEIMCRYNTDIEVYESEHYSNKGAVLIYVT